MRRVVTVAHGLSGAVLVAEIIFVIQASHEGQGFVDYSVHRRYIWLAACVVSISAAVVASIVWGRERRRFRLVTSVILSAVMVMAAFGLSTYFGVTFSNHPSADFMPVDDSRATQVASLGFLLALSVVGLVMTLRGSALKHTHSTARSS